MGKSKIKSKKISVDGIDFKSNLEANTYNLLKKNNIIASYEPHSYELFKSFKPTVPFYDERNKKRGEKKGTHKELEIKNKTIQNIKYTPDFEFDYKGIKIIIECKGHENESFPMRKKLFRKVLEDMENTMFFEIHNLKNIEEMLNIIKQQ